MSSKSKKVTVARKVERAVKAQAQTPDVPVVRTTPDAVVHLAPKGTRTIVDVARELNLTPKNARRILRAMKASKTLPDYDHTKGNRHYLNAKQIDAYKARVLARRDAS